MARTNLPLEVSVSSYNANNQLTARGTANLFYDPNGNMTSDGTNGYTWDARNRLVSTLSGASFRYDPFGRRVSKTVAGTTTNYLYDGANVAQELDGSPTPVPTANLLTQNMQGKATVSFGCNSANRRSSHPHGAKNREQAKGTKLYKCAEDSPIDFKSA